MPRTKETPLIGVAIGAGYFSRFHYDAWQRIDGVRIQAICDIDTSKAKALADEFGIPKVYADAREMMDAERADFVDIITRPDSHLELVTEAASRGLDVICQKPLAPTIEEAQQIVDAAKQREIRLMVHENFRFQPWHREIRQLLDHGAIGESLHSISAITRMGDGWQEDAYLARQPYFVSMPQLLIYETGVHFIDTFRYLARPMAGEIDGVYANLRRLNPGIVGEDTGSVLFEFEGGALGSWDASRFHESNCEDPRYTFGEFRIEGSDGSIRLSGTGVITIQKLGHSAREHLYHHENRNFAGDCVVTTQQHFVDSLRADAPFETSGDEYLKTLKVQEAVYRSAESRTPIRGLSEGAEQ